MADFRGAIGGSRDGKGDEKSGDNEDDQADEPVQVSGAFLTCAFMDSENSVIGQAKSDPQSSLEIACGLFKEQDDGSFTRIEDSNLMMQARILTNEGKLVKPEKPAERLPQGSQLQFIVPVPVEHLSGTIHVDYHELATGRYSSRRKSIPTITEFLARYAYDINNDESVERFTNREFELGPIDPMDGIEPQNKVKWWEIVAPIVVAVYGPKAKEPASYDNGGTVYVCNDCNRPSSNSKPQTQSSSQPGGHQGSQQGSSGEHQGSQQNSQGPSNSPGSQPDSNDSGSQISNNTGYSVQITQGQKKEDYRPVSVKPHRPNKRPNSGGKGGFGGGGGGKNQGSKNQNSSPSPVSSPTAEPAAGGSGDE